MPWPAAETLVEAAISVTDAELLLQSGKRSAKRLGK
ncbi:MAG: hypothetical protein QOG38_2888, partial [Hyphomicrobiales bacterium]|nr:hypothetical protein [Hyphomicrobiales bacterium]